eukprot:TRINITY_DN1774_c0_g1_i2.p1 TRINITY_DN1774_c0_g1~~TRINITY_DN1774_c0_g1_i2.p1  ORF type:complete len:494 (+),score=71.60 TRINITY_DN1774_c0_g1_i2:555-2036(+)
MFQVLTNEDLVAKQMGLVKATAAELGINVWDAATILQYFEWNVSKLQEIYWEKQKSTIQAAGISKRKRKKSSNISPDEEVECLICCDDIKSSDAFALKCAHGPYCKNCWKGNLDVTVMNSGMTGILNLTCMWPKCPIKLNYGDWQKLSSTETFNRYKYFFTKYYVECNKKISFCPEPSCDNAAICSDDIPGRPVDVVNCKCGKEYCFACGLEQHNPVLCDQLAKWQERNNDDQESIKLVMATSKKCYHCGIPTVRIDGCNHMTCRKEKGGCGGEWCWMCRGDWSSHGEHTGGFYSCNKYDSSSAKQMDDEASKLKQEADRYLHYFNRYFSHDQAKKAIPALRAKAINKQIQYRNQTNCGSVEFFTEAVDLLQESRHFLKYTYVYGYYLGDSEGKQFFEYLQANAEGIIERLADQVNAPLNELDIPAFKNRIRVNKKYIANLRDGIEEGLVANIGKEKIEVKSCVTGEKKEERKEKKRKGKLKGRLHKRRRARN